VQLNNLLRTFFFKFCKTHHALLVFENHYGMANSMSAGSTSWTLFHDLRKNFVPLQIEEEKMHIPVDDNDVGGQLITQQESELETETDNYQPCFVVLTNKMKLNEYGGDNRVPVEFLEAAKVSN